MKPRVFVGSSTENLEVANAIQENLEYDCNITLWNQGIFNLSSTALDDLIGALDNFDFAIFIFEPEDITKIRDKEYQTVRDNIVFELGLFIGRLGRERVFYLVPREIQNFHLPTDLTGLTYGKYDNIRDDGNLKAALGPFCNQVRQKLKSFIIENLTDLKNESVEAKKIASEKKGYWEFLLAAELLQSKMKSINESYYELEHGLVPLRMKKVKGDEFFQFFNDTLSTHLALAELFKKCMEELTKSFGEPGIAGNVLEIKSAVDRIVQLSKELIAWEFELNSIDPPEELLVAKQMMKGWSKLYLNQISTIAKELISGVNSTVEGINSEEVISITLTLAVPDNIDDIVDIFKSYLIN